MPWGAPWSTSWFRLRGTVPDEWAGRRGGGRRRPRVRRGLAGQPGRRPRLRPGRAADQGHRAAATTTSRSPAARSPCCVEAAANPDILAGGSRRHRWGTRQRRARRRCTGWRRADLAVLDQEVWHLAIDIEVLGELMRELDVRDPRRHEILRTLERALDTLDMHDVAGTATAARAVLAAGPRQAGTRERAHAARGGARAHRQRVAVAGSRDDPQDVPHLRQRHGPGHRVPRVRVRLLPGPAVRVGQGAPPGDLRTHRRRREGRAVGAGRRHVGRVRRATCPAARRSRASWSTAAGSSPRSSA